MRKIKKVILGLLALVVIQYLGICVLFFFKQEKALFNTVKVSKDHVFKFKDSFEEVYIPVQDDIKIHGVLFKAKDPKGLILWMPGGRGMIDSIGLDAHFYTDLNYDLFVINYRGFGKSEGEISSEAEFNNDMQAVYNHFKDKYSENKISILGYSLGAGPATALASNNNPRMLILRAPYYSMLELSQNAFPYLPVTYLQKYDFPIYHQLRKTKCPVIIIHGALDTKIPVEVSYRLKEQLKPTDKLIVINGQGHDKFEANTEYLQAVSNVFKQ